METVRDFIERISADEFYGDDVKVFVGKDRDIFINNYLKKMRTLLESRFTAKTAEEIEQIVSFLADNLNRNVKYVIDVTYTDEEQEMWLKYSNSDANERKELEQNEIYKRCKAKHDIGAGPGGYTQGRIIYSNLFKDEEEAEILKAHETTHAARCVIVGRENQKSVIQDCDIFDEQELRTNGNPDYIANTYENVFATAGYDKMEVLERGNIVESPNDIYNEETLHLFFEKMESYTTDIFLSRMENCLDVDKNEQIEYYLSILQTEQAKNRISQRLTGKNGLEDCLDDESLRISTEQEATKVVKEIVLGKEESIEETELSDYSKEKI